MESRKSGVSDAGARIAQRLQGQQELPDRLDQIPGINQRVPQVIAAEVGTEVPRFPTAQHLIRWAGLCPGHNQSAGKRRSSHLKPGNRSLRAAGVEAANAAGKVGHHAPGLEDPTPLVEFIPANASKR